MSNAFVVLLGMGTVFVGLVCIVFLCMAMSAIVKNLEKNITSEPQPSQAPAAQSAPIADRQAIIAATCAVIAEQLGTEVKNIKVVSFKKL